MTGYDYKSTEALLRRLLSDLGGVLSEGEADEVRELIDAREYGLALETLTDIVHEERKKFPAELLGLVKELCELMELDFTELEARLKV